MIHKDDPPTLDRGNVAARNRRHEINAKINVAPVVAGRHVSRSLRQGMSVRCPIECNPSVCLRVALPVEGWNCARDYGSQDHGNPGMITADGRECCCAQACMQSGHVRRRQPKSGGCFSLTDLVVVQHM